MSVLLIYRRRGRAKLLGPVRCRIPATNEGRAMADSFKDARGKAKEKAGEASGDSDMKREGQVEQAGEKAKDKVEKTAGKVKDVLDRSKR